MARDTGLAAAVTPPSRVSPVAAFAVTTTAGYGVLFYAYGVLLVPMERDLGWSRSFLTGALSAALVVGALLTVVFGRWLDRHEPRPLLLTGAFASVVLVASWGAARGQAMFLAVWVLLGACQAILFYEPAFTVLTKWFDGAARHRALTAVTLLAGLASTIFGPLTAALERELGWRGAVFVLAALLAVLTLPTFAVGLHAPPGAQRVIQPSGSSVAPRQAFTDRRFWLVTGAYVLSAVTGYAVAVLLVAFLRGERGLGAGQAALALGSVGLVQVAGRSVFTRLCARRDAIELGTWVMVAKGLGIAALLALPTPAGVVLFVTVYGAANGLSTLTRATTVAELYGADHYGSISAVVASVSALVGAVAPFAAAVAIDLAGGETPVWASFVVISLLAAIINASAARSSARLLDVPDVPDALGPLGPVGTAPAWSGFVDVNRTRLRVWEWGDAGDPAVICVHGAYDHGRMWDAFAPRLAALGYRVVAPDLRGHGDSGRLGSGMMWAPSALDIAMLAKQLDPPVGIVGHSFGGGQAMYAAGVWPDLFRWVVNIDGLGPPSEAFEETDIVEQATRSVTAAERVLGGRERRYATLEEMVERRQGVNIRLPAEWTQHLVEHGARRADDGDGWVWKADPFFGVGFPGEFDIDHLHAEHEYVTAPMLVLTGAEHDTWSDLSPEEIDDRMKYLRDARHVVVQDAGHYIHIEQPDAVLSAITSFLEELGER